MGHWPGLRWGHDQANFLDAEFKLPVVKYFNRELILWRMFNTVEKFSS
jgi:hypothetical protein